jgi:O-acetyl-ADP-ribose deacetylase (regulator of RNase III)
MAIGERKRTCFVVMPFGEKKDADGEDIDFDDIYRFFFLKTIESLDIDCMRCDEIAEAGSIHEKMFEQLYKADVVVVDITSLNANVFYELGIRHTLATSLTVLIRRKGTNIPFNIQGLQVVEYDQRKFASIERAKERIRDIIKNGLMGKKNDSPVRAVLSLNIGTEPKPISDTKTYKFPLVGGKSKKSICLITGELHKVRGIDVWVNSENTDMKMARPLDNSISGIIRNLGGKVPGKLREDIIANELNKEMQDRVSVEPGEIVVTAAGNLNHSPHEVKYIFHAAAFTGQAGKGYSPIHDVAECVEKALGVAEDTDKYPGISSILFPLMGTGALNRDFEERVKELLEAAINYLDINPDSPINTVYFLNYSDRELEVCDRLLVANAKVASKPEPTPANVGVQNPADGVQSDAADSPYSANPSDETKHSSDALKHTPNSPA